MFVVDALVAQICEATLREGERAQKPVDRLRTPPSDRRTDGREEVSLIEWSKKQWCMGQLTFGEKNRTPT